MKLTAKPAGYGEGNLKIIVPDYIKNGGCCFTMEPHLYEFTGLDKLEQEGNESKLATRFAYKNNDEAFDAACNIFKTLL